MNTPKPLTVRALTAAFAAAALVSGSLAQTLPQPTPPQPPAAPADQEEVIALETFTVTGTNIKRVDFEKMLPISIMNLEMIESRSAPTPVDLLASMPQVVSLPLNESATLGATARGDNASISLRNLTSGNTLVLLNGRRLTPHPISDSERSVPSMSVNVNQLPNRGIQQVEVLRDGASSIYGTDAVAGVVNYITQKDFRGTELSLNFGRTTYGDGKDYRATLTHGMDFLKGKGRLLTTLDYYNRDIIELTQRSFSKDSDHTKEAPAPWNDVAVSQDFFGYSTTSRFGAFKTGTVAADGSFVAARPSGVSSSLVASSGTFYFVPTDAGTVAFKTTSPARNTVERAYYWDNAPYRVIQPKSKRVNWFTRAEYDLSSRITLFGELSLYSADSTTNREPDSIGSSADYIVVPATNPFNPFGTRFYDVAGAPNADGTLRLKGTPSAVQITNKRFIDLPMRVAEINNHSYRGVLGARGKIFDSWNWEAAALYSAARTTDDESDGHRKSLFLQSINRTDTAGYNPFLYNFSVQSGALVVTSPYANAASVYAPFTSHFIRNGSTKLGSLDARASGTLMNLWRGNKIGGAFGGEFRYEAFNDWRPPYAGLNPAGSGLDPTTNDFLAFSPNADTHANRHVTAAYVETIIPLVNKGMGIPLVELLELTASARYEKYSDFGDTTKPKYGLTWRLFKPVMVRASYNEGFRAPNLAQLFTSNQVRTVTGITDGYRNVVTGLPTDGSTNRKSYSSGNLNLKTEEAKGKSVGLVIDVPKIKGLSISIDYWEIRQKSVISAPTSTQVVNDDRDALLAATQAALAAGKTISQIDLGSGTANYVGDPAVERLVVTQADIDFFNAYNAGKPASQQRAVVGGINIVRQTFFNKALVFVNGVDTDINYSLPRMAIGQFSLNTTWTYLIDNHSYDGPGKPRVEMRWTNGAAKWRGNASLSWKKNNWRANVSAFYIGDYSDSGATTNQATYEALGKPDYIVPFYSNNLQSYRFRIKDTISYNTSLSYRILSKNFLNDTTLRFGVVNLFNIAPPLSSDTRGYDPSVYTSIARGRTYNLQITKKF
jgi:outer membrane receptor protein involved in Fe transport